MVPSEVFKLVFLTDTEPHYFSKASILMEISKYNYMYEKDTIDRYRSWSHQIRINLFPEPELNKMRRLRKTAFALKVLIFRAESSKSHFIS
jgi:hypothetical protein